MRKTRFTGITVLSPDEPLTTDGGAFAGRDRDIIDRFLELGSKTHRHNNLAGLENPPSQMGASAIASGGTLRAGESFSLGYTLEDSDGGETILSPLVTFSTPPPIAAPTDTPEGMAEYKLTGDLPADTYYYAYSFTDEYGGETPVSPIRAVEREPGNPTARIKISGMEAPVAAAGAAGWRLYRAVGGGDFGYLASGVSNSYIDDGSASPNCDIPPLSGEINTTNGDNAFEIALPSADIYVAEGSFINVYMTNSGSFTDDNSLLEQFPIASAGQKALYRSLELVEGYPPDVNTSIGGAHLIDPDTELLDWHWKRPVATSGALPSGSLGDVRLVTGLGELYAVLVPSAAGPAEWSVIPPHSNLLDVRASGVTVADISLLEFNQGSVKEEGPGHVVVSGLGDKTYTHNQGVATKIWVIEHNLGKIPSVTAFDTTEKPIIGQVVSLNNNKLELRFNIEIAGKAVLN